MNVKKQIADIVSEQLGLHAHQIKEEIILIDDLGADSLDIVELTMALEEKFDIEIEDYDSEKFITVKNIVTYMEGRLNGVNG